MPDSSEDASTSRLVADLVEAADMGVVVFDDEGCRLYANAAAERLVRSRPSGGLALLLEDESLHVTRWPFTSAGQKLTAMSFSESGQLEQELRRVAAFARTASWIA